MTTKKCEGRCPNCGGDNYTLLDSEQQDMNMIYYYRCEECGCEYNEAFALVYADTEITHINSK